jgi:hypothetical protein
MASSRPDARRKGAGRKVPSRWRDEAAWNERLQRDRSLLDERLSYEQLQVLTEIGRILGAGDPVDVLALDFVVVYGSYARGEHGADSDVDIELRGRSGGRPQGRRADF